MKQLYEMEPYEFYIKQIDKDGNGDYHIALETVFSLTECPYCGSESLIRNGSRPKTIRDSNMFGARVELLVDNPRFKCKDCGQTFQPIYESIESNKRMTVRLRDYIKNQSLTKPFSALAEELGVSDTAVKTIFMERVEELDKARVLKAPTVLGIDENHLRRQYRAVFVDVEAGCLLEILPDRSKKSVKEFIQSIPGYEHIKCFTMDMWKPYKQAVYELLPDAFVIIDKFHVIKKLNEALENIRKSLRASQDKSERKQLRYSRFNLLHNMEDLTATQEKQLEELFEAYPELETPYYLKEEFRSIYFSHTRQEAVQYYQLWKQKIKGYHDFEEVASTVDDWYREIFNYFIYRYTNATTESLNKVINDIDNKGKGYTFDILRAKALYGTYATKPAKFKSITKWPESHAGSGIGFTTMITAPRTEQVVAEGWGVDIRLLQQLVDSGEFFA